MTSTTPKFATAPCDRLDHVLQPSGLDCDEETERASKQAFTAYELAMRRGHHPRLWQAVKVSPFQAHYEINLGRH